MAAKNCFQRKPSARMARARARFKNWVWQSNGPAATFDKDDLYRYVKNNYYDVVCERRYLDDLPNNYERFQAHVDLLDPRGM